MKKRKWVLYGVGAALCVVLLVAMRYAVSWRPRRVAFVGLQKGDMIGVPRSRVVSGGRVLLVECSPRTGVKDSVLAWDASTWQLKHQLPLLTPVSGMIPTSREIISCDVSPDGQELATIKSLFPQRQATQSVSLGGVSPLMGVPARPLSPVRVRTSDFIGWDARRAFVRLSADGRQIGVAWLRNILFWDVKTGNLTRRVTLPPPDYGDMIALSPDFKTAIRHGGRSMILWDIRGKPKQLTAPIIGGEPRFSPDGKRFIYWANTRFILVCANTAIGQNLWTARLNRQGRDITWSRDGKTVFALDYRVISAFAAQDGALLGSRSASNTVQILPSPVSNEVWYLDLYAQLWSQRVY